MSRRPKNKQATGISSLIEQILASKGLDKKLQQYRAWTIWDEVVGPQISQHAQPLRIREATLEVRVENATWMQQLQLLKPKILKELNKRLGESTLTNIYWKRGTVEKKKEEMAAEPDLPQLSPEQSSEIEQLTSDIGDKELQNRIKNLLTIAGRHEQREQSD